MKELYVIGDEQDFTDMVRAKAKRKTQLQSLLNQSLNLYRSFCFRIVDIVKLPVIY